MPGSAGAAEAAGSVTRAGGGTGAGPDAEAAWRRAVSTSFLQSLDLRAALAQGHLGLLLPIDRRLRGARALLRFSLLAERPLEVEPHPVRLGLVPRDAALAAERRHTRALQLGGALAPCPDNEPDADDAQNRSPTMAGVS